MNLKLTLAVLTLLSAFPAGALEVQSLPAAHVAPLSAAPSSSGAEFRLSPAQLATAYGESRAAFQASIDAIAAIPADQRDFANTVKSFELASARFSESVSPLVFLMQVSPDAAVREAAEKVVRDAGEFGVAYMGREDLFRAMKAVSEKASGLSAEDALLLKRTLDGFVYSGHGLSPQAKARLEKISERMANLQPEFEKNINNDDSVFLAKPEQLKGLPAEYVKTLEKTGDGAFRVKVTEPGMLQFLRFADDSEARHQFELLYNRRAAAKNGPLLSEALRLRDEQAQLLGRASYPDLALEDRMAGTPQKVWDFLNGLLPTLRERGQKELADLLSVKRRYEPEAARVNSWDLRYLGEKIRQERYGVDSAELKKYFPMDTVVAGTMRVYERILGVKFTEVQAPEKWHQDVRLVRIDDPATGKEIGYFYLDLYPRAGKFTHGAAFPIVSGRELEQGGYRKPVSAMVVNFEQGKDGAPTLVPIEDVETFFHEFGHLMHQTLTTARYASMSGTSVALDFVEAPSQMLENFVWQRQVLDEISGHYQDPSKKLPDDIYQKLVAMRRFKLYGGALHYARQLAFATIDLTFHTAVPLQTSRLFNQLMETLWMVPIDPNTRFEASFGHLIGGYGAGYYAYLWSEVFADDIFSRFEKEGLFNPVVGQAWRRVLETGGARPAIELLTEFLGRAPSDAAFRAKLEGRKPATAAERDAYVREHSAALKLALTARGIVAIRLDADDDGFYWNVVADGRVGAAAVREALGNLAKPLPGRVKVQEARSADVL